jgi:hypothetical protein
MLKVYPRPQANDHRLSGADVEFDGAAYTVSFLRELELSQENPTLEMFAPGCW